MNINRTTLSILFLIGVTIEGTTQQRADFSKSFSISFGAAHYRFIDEAFSHHRTQYNGTVFAMDLGYQKNKKKYLFAIDLQANQGDVSAPLQKLDGEIGYIKLATSYVRHAKDYNFIGIPSTLYVGGQVRSINYILEDLDVIEEVSLTFMQTLDLFIIQRMLLSRNNRLEITAAFPVVGFIKRTRYDGGANQDLENAYQNDLIKFIFFGSNFSALSPFRIPQFNIALSHHITRKTDFSLMYQFNYVKNNSDDSIQLFSNALVAGFRFNF